MTGEYLTTQMCHKCHALTSEARNEDGTVNRDRRCCRGTCAVGSPNNCRALNHLSDTQKQRCVSLSNYAYIFVPFNSDTGHSSLSYISHERLFPTFSGHISN
jgi:hypothetical protein